MNGNQGGRAMKSLRTLTALLILIAITFGANRDGFAKLTEPDVVFLATLAGGIEGNTITLKLDADGGTMKTALVAKNSSFVLRVPMDSVEPRVANTFRKGDKATLYLGEKQLLKVVIPERGAIVNLEIAATTPTVEEWKRLHPNDDGSGDKNRNGISDLQDYLDGRDPDFIWNDLRLSTLADNSITTGTTLNVAGTVNDNGSGNGVKGVTVNGKEATLTNGGFTIAIPLVDGPNIITAVATDNAENKTIETRTVTLNLTAPALTITQPADNSVTSKSFTDVTGSVTDPATTVTARVNEGSATSAIMNGTNFSVTVNLASGLNTIDITATEAAGKSSSAKRTVLSDTTAPALAITAPTQDISTKEGSITLSGTVTDGVTSTTVGIAVDDQTYRPTVANDGSFSQAISLPTDKSYAVVTTATDQAGNSATVQRNIIKNSGETPAVQLADVLKAFQSVFGQVTISETEKAKFDCAPLGPDGKPNPNGVVDTADIIMMLRRIVGLVTW